jgi:MoxR-like ATPase
MRLLASHREGEPVDTLEPVLSCSQVVELQEATRKIRVDETINRYILDIVHATRKNKDLHVGVSTRGALALYRAAQATAVLAGRDYVVPDDVKKLAVPVLSHRVVTKGYLHGGQRGAVEAMIERLVNEIEIRE